MFVAIVVQTIKTHLAVNNVFKNRVIYEIIWKNIVQPDRPQMTIWLMRIACWIPRATNTHDMYCLLFLHCNNGCTMGLSVTSHIHCLPRYKCNDDT